MLESQESPLIEQKPQTFTKDQEQPITNQYANPLSLTIDRMGFGKFQIILFLCLSIAKFSDGVQYVLVTLTSYIFQNQWDLTTGQITLISQSLVIGNAIGIIFCYLIQSKLGRSITIKIGTTIIIIVGILSAFTVDIYTFSTTILFTGMGVGIFMPTITALAIQMNPSQHRGRFSTSLWLNFNIGKFYMLGLTLIFIPDLQNGNWRWVLGLSIIPVFFSLIFIMVFLIESPLFLVRMNQHQKAIANLKIIARYNKSEITEEQEQSIKEMHISKIDWISNLKVLWDKQHWFLTIKTMILWSVTVSGFQGLSFNSVFILDQWTDQDNLVYFQLAIASSLFFSVSLITFLIDFKVIGRIKLMGILFIALIFMSTLCGSVDLSILNLVLIILILGFAHAVLILVYILSAEVYQTHLRITVFAVSNIAARLLTAILVYVQLWTAEESIFGMFLISSGLYLLALLIMISLNRDTTGVILDRYGKPQIQILRILMGIFQEDLFCVFSVMETTRTLPIQDKRKLEKIRGYREYLCSSGVVKSMVKFLLELKRSSSKPENPSKFIQEFFVNYRDEKTEEIQSLQQGILQLKESIREKQEEVSKLKQQIQSLQNVPQEEDVPEQ